MAFNTEERDLPGLWDGGVYNDARPVWYAGLCKMVPAMARNPETTQEFLAAMLLESGLDNLIVGNNAKNGASNPYLGIGWCQLDTGYHAVTVEAIHSIRNDPLFSLSYILNNEDLSFVGKHGLYFNKKRWHAWKPEKIDPLTGWSPLEAVREAWEKAV